MKFTTYAEVLTPDHPFANAPGHLLKDVIDRHGGRYEVRHDLPSKTREDLRRLAEITSDKKLAEIAEKPWILISLEHLRHHDPNTTRIVFGSRINREPGDGPLPGFDR